MGQPEHQGVGTWFAWVEWAPGNGQGARLAGMGGRNSVPSAKAGLGRLSIVSERVCKGLLLGRTVPGRRGANQRESLAAVGRGTTGSCRTLGTVGLTQRGAAFVVGACV